MPSASRSGGRWAGPTKGSGRRPPRHSSCSPPARPPAPPPTATAALCCLWIADHEAAIAALRRYTARTGPTTDAVDLEALCQLLEGGEGGETVEFVHLTWPIRDRQGLLRALEASPYFERGPERPSTATTRTRPRPTASSCSIARGSRLGPGCRRARSRSSEGEVIVGENVVVLETYDDNRLDRLVDRFTAAARSTIPPAHPRTKVIEKSPAAPAGHELAVEPARGPLGRGRRTAQPRAAGVHPRRGLARDAQPGPPRPDADPGGQSRRRRDGAPRRDPAAGVLRRQRGRPARLGQGPRAAEPPARAGHRPARAWTSTGCTCRDGR